MLPLIAAGLGISTVGYGAYKLLEWVLRDEEDEVKKPKHYSLPPSAPAPTPKPVYSSRERNQPETVSLRPRPQQTVRFVPARNEPRKVVFLVKRRKFRTWFGIKRLVARKWWRLYWDVSSGKKRTKTNEKNMVVNGKKMRMTGRGREREVRYGCVVC